MDKTRFYISPASMWQTLLVTPFFLYLAWDNYSGGDLFLAGLFLLIPLVYVAGVVRQRGTPLFAFAGEELLVRDSFAGNDDVPLAEITGIDESPWIGINLMVNFKPHRLFLTRLSKDDREAFLRALRYRTGLDADSIPAVDTD